MPSRDMGPDFAPGEPPANDQNLLPGDPAFSATRKFEPPEPPPPPAPRRYPAPLVVLGGILLVAVLVAGFLWLRMTLADPAGRDDPGPEPLTTLAPRDGTPAPLQTAGEGQRVQIEGLYGKGSFMVVRHEWSTTGDLPTSEGRQYLNVEVRYDASEGSMFIKPDFFSAYDMNKTEYLVGIGSGKDPLPQQELKAGQSASGWVSIELPPGRSFFIVTDEGINPLVMIDIPGP